MPHRQFSAYQDWSTWSYNLLEKLTKVLPQDLAHLKFEEKRVPIPLSIRFFLKMRETSEGTSYKMVPLVFRHFPATTIRVLPDFALLSLFFTVFRVLLTLLLFLAQTTRKISVDCKCMCARVYMCEWKNTEKTQRKNQRNAYGMGVLCGVRKFKKETMGKSFKTWTPFFLARYGHPWAKKAENVHFHNALFLRFHWDLSTFSAESPIPNTPKQSTFLPEVLIQKS